MVDINQVHIRMRVQPLQVAQKLFPQGTAFTVLLIIGETFPGVFREKQMEFVSGLLHYLLGSGKAFEQLPVAGGAEAGEMLQEQGGAEIFVHDSSLKRDL